MSGVYSLYHVKFPHKQYIGSTEQKFSNRFTDHKKELKRGKHRLHLQHICDKYGIDGIRMQVLVEARLPRKELRSLEQGFITHHILVYGRDNLLNGTTSSTSMLDDPEVIEKTKAINSIRMKQNNKSEDYLNKVRNGINNTREANAEYVAERLKWAREGLNSETNRAKCTSAIRKSCAKAVVCSNGMEFEAINDAVRYLKSIGFTKATKASVSRCAQGKTQVGYGFVWTYK